MKSREELININNQNCILVEFCNDQNNIETGYSAWLINIDQNQLNNIIEEKITAYINWSDCDIK